MGNYVSQADVEIEIPTVTLAQLTATSGTTPDAATVEQQIGFAESELDASLGQRIKTPVNLSEFPDLANWVKGLALAFAVWRLYHLKNMRVPPVDDAYKAARERLASFVAGETAVPGALTPTETSVTGPPDEWGGETRKAGRANQVGL